MLGCAGRGQHLLSGWIYSACTGKCQLVFVRAAKESHWREGERGFTGYECWRFFKDC